MRDAAQRLEFEASAARLSGIDARSRNPSAPTLCQASGYRFSTSGGNQTSEGAPYCKYWEDTIAPGMLNTGSTPELINKIIRKPKVNYHSHALAHTHTPISLCRAVRAAVLQTV